MDLLDVVVCVTLLSAEAASRRKATYYVAGFALGACIGGYLACHHFLPEEYRKHGAWATTVLNVVLGTNIFVPWIPTPWIFGAILFAAALGLSVVHLEFERHDFLTPARTDVVFGLLILSASMAAYRSQFFYVHAALAAAVVLKKFAWPDDEVFDDLPVYTPRRTLEQYKAEGVEYTRAQLEKLGRDPEFVRYMMENHHEYFRVKAPIALRERLRTQPE